MKKNYADYFEELNLSPGVSERELDNFDSEYRELLPDDYWDYLLFSNGCAGTIGNSYLFLWELSELIPLNEGYCIKEFAPDFILIGTSGCGEAYGYDTKEKYYVTMPFEVLGAGEYLVRISPTFEGFLQYLYTRENMYDV